MISIPADEALPSNAKGKTGSLAAALSVDEVGGQERPAVVVPARGIEKQPPDPLIECAASRTCRSLRNRNIELSRLRPYWDTPGVFNTLGLWGVDSDARRHVPRRAYVARAPLARFVYRCGRRATRQVPRKIDGLSRRAPGSGPAIDLARTTGPWLDTDDRTRSSSGPGRRGTAFNSTWRKAALDRDLQASLAVAQISDVIE